MALDIQTVTPVVIYTPYERPPQAQTLWTAIPRGMHSVVASVELDAKAINDDALLTIQHTLPGSYAYVMESLYFGIVQNRALDWGDRVNLNIQNFFRGTTGLMVALTANYVTGFVRTNQDDTTRVTSSAGGGAATDPQGHTGFPTFPLIDTNFTGVQINFSAWNNNNTASTAGILDFYINFWQFDLEQVRKFPINSPLPVQLR